MLLDCIEIPFHKATDISNVDSFDCNVTLRFQGWHRPLRITERFMRRDVLGGWLLRLEGLLDTGPSCTIIVQWRICSKVLRV